MSVDCDEHLVEGAVIYLDIDNYLERARDMPPAEELAWASTLQSKILATANDYEINPVRTFGDAILLYAAGSIDGGLYGRLLEFFKGTARALAEENVSFKAVSAAGRFYLNQELWASGGMRLTGPLVNLAGKRMRHCRAGSVVVLWPEDGQLKDQTFRQLSEADTMRESVLCLRDL